MTIKTLSLSVVLAIAAFSATAQDKSASSVIQLPAAGGTVTREEGSFSLNSNTGSANFRLPLPELPQRGRFGAQVSLSYNQFAGDTGGGLGVGWGFSVPSILVNDDLGTAIPGSKPGGDFFSRLSLNGARLVFLGVEGGVWRYRPEFSEQAVEVRYHPQPFDVAILDRLGATEIVTLPAGFDVQHPDGSRMIFSADPAVAEGKFAGTERYVTRWPMVLHVNANRDAVRYRYEKHSGRSYLTEVSFAGGQSTYQFELIDTQPSLVSYATGTRQQNARLYGKVTARFLDTVYGQWCMGYIGRSGAEGGFAVRAHPDCQAQAEVDLAAQIDPNSVNVLDQLRVLYRYGDTGGAPYTPEAVRFPAISFDYSSWTAADLAQRPLVYDAPNMAWAADVPPRNLELADLNMDALVDIVRTTEDGAQVFLGEGDLGDAFARSIPLELTRTTEAGLQRPIAPRLSDDRFHFADILGDSYVDVVEIETGVMHVFDGKADGAFPYLGRSIALPAISPTTFADGNGRFQDLNMDGLSDIITTRLSADGRTEWQVFINLTRRQPDGGYVVNFGAQTKAFPFASQDGQLLGRQNVRLTDVNGDRLPDFVVIRPADQGFCLYENQGNLFSREPGALLFGDAALNDPVCGAGRFAGIGGMQATDSLQTMWLVDANGDGIMDFASMGSRTDQMRVWLGFGDGSFLRDPVDLALNLRVQVGTGSQTFRSRVADLDADGQSEIIVFQEASGEDIKPVVVIDFNRTETMQLVKANLLTVVDFASGRRHDIRYATSIDEMMRDRRAGLETRSLHFPVVVAKQMVTSEGVPGQERADVQTEEYYYHRPFYDVINRRFIGFAEVDRVTYGDEHLGLGRVTQTSAITREQYYTFADTAADLHLAGKLRVRRVYEMLPEPVLLASAEETVRLNPSESGLHSLSTATRTQGLPEAGRQLSCQAETWIAAARGDGTNFLRRTQASLSEAAGTDQQEDATSPECLLPTKTQTFDGFDAANYATVETVSTREIAGPEGLTVPGFSRTTQTDYATREALAPLGILNAASERRILAGSRLLSRETFTYLPQAGGRMGSRTLEVFSGLGQVPEALAALHSPTHALTKSMVYDVFGNITGMSDDLGQIEAVSFDPTGTLPLTHTRFAGGEARFDQVQRMAYDGPRAGQLSRMTTPLGFEISYRYDGLGRRLAETGADGAETLFSYQIGEGGRPSLILTSKRRYLSAAETPEGESEWIDKLAAYNARGNQIAEVENVAEGGVRVYNFAIYNRNERQTFRRTPYTTTDFQGAGDLDARAILAIGDIPRPSGEIGNAYTYDGAGRMIRETHPSGKVSELQYEAWGTRRVTRYDDQFAGSVTTEEWRLGNENGMAALVAADGQGVRHVTQFRRDGFGYLSEIQLPGETVPRRFVFNSIGDVEWQSIPGMGDYYAFYDARGRQSARARVAADGQTKVLTFAYDFLNRKVQEAEDGTPRVEILYDEAVQIASAAPLATPVALPLDKITRIITRDPNGLYDATQRFAYDANGRLIQHEVEMDGKSHAESYHRTLDARIDRATGPRGLSSQFALGPDENLHAVTINHPSFAAPETVIENIGYNAEGRIDRIDYRMGAFTEMTYNPETLFLTRIASVAGGLPLQDLAMTFNGNGSITEIIDQLASRDLPFGHVNRSGSFGYDFKNQLVRYARYGETAEFAYTPAGALARNDEFEAGAALAAPADAQTGLIPAGTAAKPYSFDGFGQLATSPSITGTVFDAYGRLIRAQSATHDVFFGYDQTGRRLYKRQVPLDAPEAAETYFFPLETFEIGPKGEESFVNIGPARLVRMEHETGRWFYYLKDHLESSDYVIASDGVPVEQMLYRAYGTEHAPEVLAPAWGRHIAAIPAALPREKTHHRFTGKYLDDATGLYYYGARYYDPALGRFISPDPLYMADPERCTTNPVACTLFAYANNNPMAFIDPTGLDGVVAGDEAYRRQVEETLQRIDPTARVDRETGEISQSWLHGLWLDIVDFFVPGSGHDTGRELVSQVIESEQTTTIQFSADDASVRSADPTVDWATTPGDAVVNYDPAFTPELAEFDPSTGGVSMEVSDPGIIIGHELIHATHVMAGQVSGVNPVIYNGLDGSVQVAPDEEARTAGVGGTSRPDDITENDLREMIGLNPRNHY